MNLKKSGILLTLLMMVNILGCSSNEKGESKMTSESSSIVTSSVVPVDVKDLTVAVGERIGVETQNKSLTVLDPSIAAFNGTEIIGFTEGETSLLDELGNEKYHIRVVPNKLGTTHVYDVRETKISLVKDGRSDYVLVVPQKETDEMITTIAVSEFNDLFNTATGLTLPVLKDNEINENSTEKYIFIGNTRQAAYQKIVADRETFGQNGFVMKTVGNSLFCVGGGRFGTLYTVYEFMKWQFNFQQYAANELAIDKDVKECNILNFNIKDVPDFEWRVASYGDVFSVPFEDYYPHRMRVQRLNGELFVPVAGTQYVHNYLDYLPKDKYEDAHPTWYSTCGNQLCLTRDVEGLSNEVVRLIEEYLTQYPEISCISFTQEDKNTWCRCSSCKAMYDEYGTDAAANIKFINIIAKKLRPWLEEKFPGRTVRLTIFAYHKVEDAPAVLNAETGEYEPMDESVILDDMVSVFYAPIFGSFYQELDSEVNKRLDTNMRKWGALTDSIFLWIYQLCCDNYLQPYDGINSIQERFIYAYQHNVEMLFDQAEYNMPVDTDWLQLKSYLLNRMMWDISLDPYEIIQDFIVHYFKDSSKSMQKFYDSWKQWMGYVHVDLGFVGTITEVLLHPDVFPERVLDEWLGYFDEAYKDIENLKDTDKEKYDLLEKRITVESISPRFLKMLLYRNSMTVEGWREYYLSFKADAARVGVTNYNEWNAMSPLLENVLRDWYPDLSTVYPDLF